MQRVNVIGTSGSGKTTLAREPARRLGYPHNELDALYHGPNWTAPPEDEFRERLRRILDGHPGWVTDGNYRVARDVIWSQADTVIWLDYPMIISLWRVWWRTLRRVVTQEKLWENENRETWKDQFLSNQSLFVWVITTHGRRRRNYPELFSRPENAHLQVIRFRWPRQAQRWLEQIQPMEES
ncbi:MAG: adenylate kinase [Anaerolineae bacterium]|nr:adenylate kinase [Anaerolineae bacterium]